MIRPQKVRKRCAVIHVGNTHRTTQNHTEPHRITQIKRTRFVEPVPLSELDRLSAEFGRLSAEFGRFDETEEPTEPQISIEGIMQLMEQLRHAQEEAQRYKEQAREATLQAEEERRLARSSRAQGTGWRTSGQTPARAPTERLAASEFQRHLDLNSDPPSNPGKRPQFKGSYILEEKSRR